MDTIYDYEEHVKLLQQLDARRKLSRNFTTLPNRTASPYVMQDINPMQCLNGEQRRRRLQNHICPMPFDTVDRLIEMYSNPGDTIRDDFGGLGTTGVRAIKKGRKAIITELSPVYGDTNRMYLEEAERSMNSISLFDLLTA